MTFSLLSCTIWTRVHKQNIKCFCPLAVPFYHVSAWLISQKICLPISKLHHIEYSSWATYNHTKCQRVFLIICQSDTYSKVKLTHVDPTPISSERSRIVFRTYLKKFEKFLLRASVQMILDPKINAATLLADGCSDSFILWMTSDYFISYLCVYSLKYMRWSLWALAKN